MRKCVFESCSASICPENEIWVSLKTSYCRCEANKVLESFDPLRDVFEVSKTWIETKTTADSSILSNHLNWLPLVPWVIQKGLFIAANWLQKQVFDEGVTIETHFALPIKPWDSLDMDMEWILSWEKRVMTAKISQDSGHLCECILDPNDIELLTDSEDMLSRCLLQTWSFRLASAGSFISQHTQWVVNVGDLMCGFYDVPKNFPYCVLADWKDIVYPPLIEEMVAQIWSLAMAKATKPIIWEDGNIDPKSNILTFLSSKCAYTWAKIMPWSRVSVVWQVSSMEKRKLSFTYNAFSGEGKLILSWIIEWNVIPSKLLSKM